MILIRLSLSVMWQGEKNKYTDDKFNKQIFKIHRVVISHEVGNTARDRLDNRTLRQVRKAI